MNKLLNEMMLKAEGYAEDTDLPWLITYTEKLAELIVKECIGKAKEEAERYLGFPNLENADMYAKVMYNYQELLKETFGVE